MQLGVVVVGVVTMDRSKRENKKPPKGDLDSPRLIKLVAKYRILWDPKFPGYKDVHQKELAWNKIASNLYGSTGKVCQYQWSLLRAARSNNRRDARSRNLSGIATSKKKKP
ncbi:Bone morphogenetic protein 3 [Frankliniella fusca]|uniref:Bone morphogenetic protein 3 n=1 Tax=Frankliniella fusca TaxID=407009 RepID=A0AAE1LVV1_9NEOP|nr:Bone morphogenetic protein 3 [Frankliniella fusca]